MATQLSVNGLCKQYESFALKNVSFEVLPGSITGFIGRNGAGKTTTLKSLLNFVHPDKGEIRFFDRLFSQSEMEIKQRIGFVSGGIDYYPRKKLRTIAAVTKQFYNEWDDSAFQNYMTDFGLDGQKNPHELSEGMKVKFSLALALSHNAELLILDEPTSGLDPVSRDDLLDVFLSLAEKKQVGILFSTHITSDLEKCADHIVYIKNGTIIEDCKTEALQQKFRLVALKKEQDVSALSGKLIGMKRNRDGYTALVKTDDLPLPGVHLRPADLESIMVHLEKE